MCFHTRSTLLKVSDAEISMLGRNSCHKDYALHLPYPSDYPKLPEFAVNTVSTFSQSQSIFTQ